MPPACTVCMSTRYSENGPRLTLFRFPKDESLKLEWIEKLKANKFLLNTNSRVCEKHFKESDILRENRSKDGERVAVFPFGHPRLKPGVVPSLLLDSKNMKPASNSYNKYSKKKETTNPRKEKKVKISEKPMKELIMNDEVISCPRDTTPIDGYIATNQELLDFEESFTAMESFNFINNNTFVSKGSSIPVANIPPFNANLDTDLIKVEIPMMNCNTNELGSIRVSHGESVASEVDRNVFSEKLRQLTEQYLSSSENKFKGTSLPQAKWDKSLFDISEDNFDSRTCEDSGDLFDAFGRYVAGKLRKLEWNFCANALMGIMNVISEAEQDQVKSDENPNSSACTD